MERKIVLKQDIPEALIKAGVKKADHYGTYLTEQVGLCLRPADPTLGKPGINRQDAFFQTPCGRCEDGLDFTAGML